MPVIPALPGWRQKDQVFKVIHNKCEVLFEKKKKKQTKQQENRKQEAGEESSVKAHKPDDLSSISGSHYGRKLTPGSYPLTSM